MKVLHPNLVPLAIKGAKAQGKLSRGTLGDKDKVNICTFHGINGASVTALDTFKDKLPSHIRPMATNYINAGNTLLKAIIKSMSEKQEASFEEYTAFIFDVVDEVRKCEDGKQALLLKAMEIFNDCDSDKHAMLLSVMLAFNAGDVQPLEEYKITLIDETPENTGV